MQTFLPYPDFKKSAASLDKLRLGKQRVETYQLLRANLGITTSWRHHPAALMWRGHERHLIEYGFAMCDEWTTTHGYRDTCRERIAAFIELFPQDTPLPPWFGNERFHRAHRANLVHKKPEHYVKQFGPLPWEPYYWPVRIIGGKPTLITK